MTIRYVAFDIETATDVPGEGFDWEEYRPLGISSAATFAYGEKRPRLWHGQTPDGKPADRLQGCFAVERRGRMRAQHVPASSGHRVRFVP